MIVPLTWPASEFHRTLSPILNRPAVAALLPNEYQLAGLRRSPCTDATKKRDMAIDHI